MILSLLATILIEGVVIIGYARWRKKPAGRLFLIGVLANLLTQSLLWGALYLFPTQYLAALFTAEGCIVVIESAILHCVPGARLPGFEALGLSLAMNLTSFGIGWFLPV
jgi:hypothetical protein